MWLNVVEPVSLVPVLSRYRSTTTTYRRVRVTILLPLDTPQCNAQRWSSRSTRICVFLLGLERGSPRLFFLAFPRRPECGHTPHSFSENYPSALRSVILTGGADVVPSRASSSPARLGALLRIVLLSSPDSTRLVGVLSHWPTSRIVSESASTHKHLMARKSEWVVLPMLV
ncbi:hypothetical protein B0H13DRAFT_1978751 [Mycena leptocephala]|nr:hypothetical protein B0H13DRAFT_1978751 [Mycena leptocephala]